ncbi:hypothetical protein GCM10010232_67620 [Streptomyces amakusaensis]|uniref:Sel1 repeat family protein n=1 Tax=Streptomyces amakusaensis TaxID=67271 RepID=A0ABW0ATR8_9ACTN
MSWEKRLADPDAAVREPRRAFDVAAGLSSLAREAGYDGCCARPAQPSADNPAPARHQLDVLSRWTLTQAGAASHIEDLATSIGDNNGLGKNALFDGWTDVDIDGVQVFACMLYLTRRHPESAQFWWKLAAGAGHNGAAYCLHLYHLSCGELREADFWKRQLQAADGPSADFLKVLQSSAGRNSQQSEPTQVLTRCLAEFERLADRHDADGLVCRPDRRLADRLHDLAGRH